MEKHLQNTVKLFHLLGVAIVSFLGFAVSIPIIALFIIISLIILPFFIIAESLQELFDKKGGE